jgi:excisionase family DNA binding protein
MIDDNRLYTLQEIAELSAYSKKTIYRKILNGTLPRVGGRREKIRVWGRDIRSWLEKLYGIGE